MPIQTQPPSLPTNRFSLRGGRFQWTWLPTAAMLLVVGLTGALATWQWGRGLEKIKLGQSLAAQTELPVLELAPGADWAALRYRRAAITGVYLADKQIFLDNQQHQGRAGYQVLTPLQADNGLVILIARGFVARAANYPSPPVVPPPVGKQQLSGTLAAFNQRFFELSSDVVAGPVWQNISTDRLKSTLSLELPPLKLNLTSQQTALIPIVDAPTEGAAKHHGYAVQWGLFGLTAIGFWLASAFRRTKTTAPPSDPSSDTYNT